VANAMKQYCSREKCDFVVTLGDNFQDEPVTSVTDPLWNTIYKDVYGGLGLPFYVTLGNHDVDESWQVEINYSALDSSWHLPSQDYTFGKPDTAPLIDFFVINTGDWEYESAEETWLKSALQKSSATWKFLLSHAPIISNGSEHGDMSIDFGYDDPAVNLVTDICGRIDLTLSGHDHIFSYLAGATFGCNIKQLVLGTGGGDLYDFNASDPRAVKSASMNGFGWFKVEKSTVTFRFIDTTGNVYYQTTWTK
jgi:3',5'-cyclic AMP phosphodiesterase CpdA